jgi:integrase/recombinase XerD
MAPQRDYINFRARTRKASQEEEASNPSGVSPSNIEGIAALIISQTQIHPGCLQIARSDKPITIRWADMILRQAVEKAGLAAKGISTHSTRRSFITKLHRNRTDLYTIPENHSSQRF